MHRILCKHAPNDVCECRIILCKQCNVHVLNVVSFLPNVVIYCLNNAMAVDIQIAMHHVI